MLFWGVLGGIFQLFKGFLNTFCREGKGFCSVGSRNVNTYYFSFSVEQRATSIENTQRNVVLDTFGEIASSRVESAAHFIVARCRWCDETQGHIFFFTLALHRRGKAFSYAMFCQDKGDFLSRGDRSAA